MTVRFKAIFFFLPVYLAGQLLIKNSAPNTYILERKAVMRGQVDPYFAGRISYEWRMAMPDGRNDLLFSRKADSWFRQDRLKIYPETTASFYLNGGHLKQNGFSADISPTVNLTARYAFPPLGRFGVLFWGRFEKHSVVGEGSLSDVTYDLSWQKEVGKVWFPGEDSSWAEYNVGDAGMLLFYPGGDITLAKANPVWGTGYAGNVWLSDKAPSFVFVSFRHRFSEKWTLSFVHGTLNSGFRDTSWAGSVPSGDVAIDFPLIKKFVVAHRLDYTPAPHMRLGFGESIIYGGRGPELQYVLPFMLFLSAQSDLGDTDNLQWMIDAEVIREGTGRVYGSLYMDEWDLMDTFNKKESRNWWAYQIGLTGDVSSLLAVESLVRLEFTHLTPYVYVHKNKLNSFEHYGHVLGFWSGSNSDNVFVALEGRVKRGWWIQVYGQRTRRGEVTDETITRQYRTEKIPFLYRSYDGAPESRTLVGLRGELSLATWLRVDFDLFSDAWDQRSNPSNQDRYSSRKLDAIVKISVGM